MKAVILPRNKHNLSRKAIADEALKVLYRLHRHGFKAYLVGGCVRDILLDRTPKDFDVVTNARPRAVRRLFRNAFLIGRRFRLVHVKFKNQIIEVSTFRRTPHQRNKDDGDLMLRRENTFGSPRQDALRRDFTINGLFYNIADFSIIDYVGGLRDLEKGILNTIGDPEIRFQEDPVRMIRAVRIAGRIQFEMNPAVWNAILKYHTDILKCAPSRLLEEIFTLLRHRSAERSIDLLHRTRLMESLIPGIHNYRMSSPEDTSPMQMLRQFDLLPLDHPFRTPPLMLAVLLFPLIMRNPEQLKSGDDMRKRIDECLRPFAVRFRMPRRYFDRITQMFIAQRRFLSAPYRKFKPAAFIGRDFFGETLTLAVLQMNLDPEKWVEQRKTWYDRIIQADISPAYKTALLNTLGNFNNRRL